MTLLLLIGCEETKPEQEAMISLDPEQETNITVPSDGDSFDVCFTSSKDWTAEIVYKSGGEGWASLDIASGKGGYAIARLKVNVMKNTESEPRSAEVVISSGEKKAVVSFTQEKKSGLLPGPNPDLVFRLVDKSAEVPSEGGTVEVTVEYNVEYKCEITVDWIREIESKSYDQKTHVFEVFPNESENPRNTTISFCGNGTCIPFMIEQAGSPVKPYLEIDVESMNVSAAGTSQPLNLNVISNVAWTIECASDWISIDPMSGEGDGSIGISVAENGSTESRSASVKVSSADGNISRTLVVLQGAAAEVFELTEEYAAVGPDAGTINVAVRYNVDYRCEIMADWIREVTLKAVNENIHTFEIMANDSEEPREALIYFISNGETIDFTVYQEGMAPKPYLRLSSGGLSIIADSENGLPTVVEVFSNVGWIVECDVEWLTISPMAGNGNGSFNITVSKNESTEERQAEFLVKTEDGSVVLTYYVNQEGAEPYFEISEKSAEIKAEGGTAEVTVRSNIEYKYEIPVDWIREVTTKTAGENVHTFEIMPNETFEERVAVISFCGNDNCLPFTITQKGQIPDYRLEVDAKTISVETAGTASPIKVNVTSNVQWNVTCDADWCVVSPVLGENDGSFEVSVSESGLSEPRMAEITVSSPMGVSRTISVIQAPASSGSDDDSWPNEDFIHKSLVMRFTATWCGYCPSMATALSDAQKALPDKIEALSVHGGGSDLASAASNALTNHYGIGVFPTGLVDCRTTVENYDLSTTTDLFINAVKDTETKYETVTGASWTSSVSGDQAILNLSLYIKKSGSYKITALLVEDGIVGYQADYNNGSSSDYVHNGVIRASFTEATGDALEIDADGQKKDFNYSVTIPDGCNKDNLKIVVYVQRKDLSYYVDNTTSAKLGATKMLAVKSGNWGSGNEGIVPGDDIIL